MRTAPPIVELVQSDLGPSANEVEAGVRSFANASAGWRIRIRYQQFSRLEVELKDGGASGLIVPRSFFGLYPQLRNIHIPTVILDWPTEVPPGMGCVVPDNELIGRMSAKHLIERSFRSYAFFGRGEPWSCQRQKGFEEELAAHRLGCVSTGSILDRSSYPDWPTLTSNGFARGWLESLERPVGVMVAQDVLAPPLFEIAEESGWQIGRDWAVVGVDDRGLLCGRHLTSLTSTGLNLREVASEGARLLHRMMSGEPAPRVPIVVPPAALVARQSTDTPLYNDALVHEVLQLVRRRVDQWLSIEGLARRLHVSRSTIERRYRAAAGHPLGELLRRERLGRVRELIGNSNLALWQIADRLGYSGSPTLSRAFRQEFGLSPREYRAQVSAQRSDADNPAKTP